MMRQVLVRVRKQLASWLLGHRGQSSPCSFGRKLSAEILECRYALTAVTVANATDVISPGVDLSSIAALVANPGADGISLREAVMAADADTTTAVDTILFDSSTMTGATITLRKVNGQLNASSSLQIDGASLGITIQGEDSTGGFHNDGLGIRLFNFTDPSAGNMPPSVEMIGLTVKGADPALNAGAPQGGAIRSESLLTLRNMTISENGADLGAGIYLAVASNSGTPRSILTVVNSHIDNNSAYGIGGGLYVRLGSGDNGQDAISFIDSTISNNVASPRQGASSGGFGGGIYIEGGGFSTSHHSIQFSSSDLESNHADAGGAVVHHPK